MKKHIFFVFIAVILLCTLLAPGFDFFKDAQKSSALQADQQKADALVLDSHKFYPTYNAFF